MTENRRSSAPGTILAAAPEAERPLIPPPPVPPDPTPLKPIEPFNPIEEPTNLTKPLFEPAFLPPKSISHSKISPSSIPNPSPSVSTTKPLEPGYPNYGSYLYSIPGYSAFQPLSYRMMPPPPHQPIPTSEPSSSEFLPFPSIPKENTGDKIPDVKVTESQPIKDVPKPQTDFEEQFTPEIIPATTTAPEVIKSINESKMSITSLAQGSGATVTIPAQISNKEINKKKAPERFSLKTSIPISKIDMRSVGNPPEPIITNAVTKKPTPFNPVFSTKSDTMPKIEIQSNILLKEASKDTETSQAPEPQKASHASDTPASINNINSLISTAETDNKNDSQFRKPEPKNEVINEVKDPPAPPNFTPPNTNIRPVSNPMTVTNTKPVTSPTTAETSKVNFPTKPSESNLNEQKNQILFIQNKNPNPKMLLTIQKQNPQVLLQRTNLESKNVQVPSRLSSQNKHCKEDTLENGTSSKVVALKRLHQENCDENDFENLITENQIYGNKIVVKEKWQRTLKDQDLKNKKSDKMAQETKNVVLQPNFVYLSNVQFPANLMMIKNNTKVTQSTESSKINKVTSNENKITNEAGTMTNSNQLNAAKNNIVSNVAVSKEIHVLKSSNNVLCNNNSKTDLVFQQQKVIMNPQIVYQVPMIVDADNKLNQPLMNRDYQKFIGPNKKEYTKLDQKPNDKLFIACPYQMDSKLQPKIVITNIRPKVSKVDEVSSLDIYEKRKKLRRLKYLSNRDITKEIQRGDSVKKVPEKIDMQSNLITPDKINEEICKEFTITKGKDSEGDSESESDYDEDDLKEYDAIIEEYGPKIVENNDEKADFLTHFDLGTHDVFREKNMMRQERILRRDAVASAYISAGRIDRLTNEDSTLEIQIDIQKKEIPRNETNETEEIDKVAVQKKQIFFSQLKLAQVTPQYKERYEFIWKEILNERKRRNGDIQTETTTFKQPKIINKNLELDPNGQLQILTEIKKSVNENNNLIKKKLDSSEGENVNDGDSIHALAEKNFSELSRLSKMADRSVKMITGQDARKRDLNPGFDSENIQKTMLKQLCQSYSHIKIPSKSKIIALKSNDHDCAAFHQCTQATSMDEPVNSAAGLEAPHDTEGAKDAECQVEETLPWPGIEAVIKSYKEMDSARRKEINDLHRRNTVLRVESAHMTSGASRDSDRARALLAERKLLANEEAAVRRVIQRIMAAVEAVKNS